MRTIYLERKTFLKYDDEHFIVYLNEEILQDYMPETLGDKLPEPMTGYAYTGNMPDGGMLIEAKDAGRDSLINGIIRSRYTQSEEDAIKTHRLQLIAGEIADSDKVEEYNQEWANFNDCRNSAKRQVDIWLS